MRVQVVVLLDELGCGDGTLEESAENRSLLNEFRGGFDEVGVAFQFSFDVNESSWEGGRGRKEGGRQRWPDRILIGGLDDGPEDALHRHGKEFEVSGCDEILHHNDKE